MNIIIKPTYYATITIGSQIGYTNECYTKKTLITILQQFQKKQITESDIYLSACVSKCDIVLSNQIEPHFKLDFINYPKFPLEETVFKTAVELLATYLMEQFQQNRLVIVYHNETKMLEKNEGIDPRI